MIMPSLLLLALLSLGRPADQGPVDLRQVPSAPHELLPASDAGTDLAPSDPAEGSVDDEEEEEALPEGHSHAIADDGPLHYLGELRAPPLLRPDGNRHKPLRGPPRSG
jgi:hypothetical protein